MKLRVYYNKADHHINLVTRVITSYYGLGLTIAAPLGSPYAKNILPLLLKKAHADGKYFSKFPVMHSTNKNIFFFGANSLSRFNRETGDTYQLSVGTKHSSDILSAIAGRLNDVK